MNRIKTPKLVMTTALAAAIGWSLGTGPASAKMETRTLPTVKCDTSKVKEAGGGAIVRATKVRGQEATRVTIDTKKGNWAQVNEKLMAAGCMKKK